MSTKPLTSEEVAERLNIPERTLDLLRKQGKLPFVKLTNKTIRYNWDRVEAAYNALERKAITTKGKGRQ